MKTTSILPCLLLALSLFTSCQHSTTPGESHAETHDGEHHTGEHHTGVLEISSPIKKDTLYYNEYVCQIKAYQHIELKAMEIGYLQKVLVDEGQLVQKGQLLFEIQPTIYQAEIQKAQAELEQAEAEWEKTRIEVQNLTALVDSNIVSVNELALAQAEMHKAEAHVDNAKAELNLMEAHLEFTKIRAPFSGIVGEFEDIRLGSLLEEGEELTTLTDNSKMWVYFNVPEAVYLDYAEYPSEVAALELQLANNKIFDQKGKITAIEADLIMPLVPFRLGLLFKIPEDCSGMVRRVISYGRASGTLCLFRKKQPMKSWKKDTSL
jgi:membrane fusion protein (multidrug efflux system)